MMPFRCFIEVLDGILSLFLVCGKQSFPSPGKVPGISAKTVHFPLVVSSVTCPTRTLLSLTNCNADIAFIDKLSFIGKRGMGALE